MSHFDIKQNEYNEELPDLKTMTRNPYFVFRKSHSDIANRLKYELDGISLELFSLQELKNIANELGLSKSRRKYDLIYEITYVLFGKDEARRILYKIIQ